MSNKNKADVIIISESCTWDGKYEGLDEIISLKEISYVNDETVWKSGKIGCVGENENDFPVENCYPGFQFTFSQLTNATMFVDINFGMGMKKKDIKKILLNLISNL